MCSAMKNRRIYSGFRIRIKITRIRLWKKIRILIRSELTHQTLENNPDPNPTIKENRIKFRPLKNLDPVMIRPSRKKNPDSDPTPSPPQKKDLAPTVKMIHSTLFNILLSNLLTIQKIF